MVNKFLIVILSIAILVLIIFGYLILTFFGMGSKSVNKARDVADSFYSKLINQDYSSLKDYYHPDLLNVVPEDNVTNYFKGYDKEYGKIKKYSYLGFGISTKTGQGTTVTLRYDVQRERNTTQEIYDFFRGSNEDSYKVVYIDVKPYK